MKTLNKKELRQKYRAHRDSFGEEFIEQSSKIACENLAKSKEFIGANTILFYYPIKNEISPLPLLEHYLKMGKTIAFPVCNTENSTLIFKKVETLNDLFPSIFGLFEPNDNCETITPNEKTLCIVPALAFSQDGHRLGYGKGYYDRFLKNFQGISVGFSYSEFVCDKLPHSEHDIPLNMIVTESEVRYIDQKN